VPRLGVVVLAVVVGLAAPVFAQTPPAPTADDCLVCHGDRSAARDDGRTVAVDGPAYAASIHGVLSCVDCHQDLSRATEFPHPGQLKPVDCASCHDAAVRKYSAGAHALARARGGALAATCVDCHGTHDIRPSSDAASRTHHLKLPETCGRCHGDPRVISRGPIEIGDVFAPYQDSIHGRAISRSGLIVAPNCSDCHGSHDVQRAGDPASPVHRRNVPGTCGACHEGIAAHYRDSVHGAAVASGDLKAATCVDCHTAHAVQRADTDAWQLGAIAECGTCHAASMRTYRDTFHGKITELGFTRVAACADCHSAHAILPASNPASTVSEARLVSTCGACHPGANASFVAYDPHPDPRNYDRNPVLWWVYRFYTVLIAGCFGVFGLHSVLWFRRSRIERRRS
jgi:hypothetical protein